MDNVSKVIFTCLAIGYTFLIYQNNELNNEIQSIKDSEVMQLKDLWKIEESYKIALDNQLRIDDIEIRKIPNIENDISILIDTTRLHSNQIELLEDQFGALDLQVQFLTQLAKF